MEVVRRRRLGRGEPHADVERLLSRADGLTRVASLALFDDIERGDDVLPRLQRECSPAGAEAFRQSEEGAQELPAGDAVELVRQAGKLAAWLRGLP